MINIFIHCTLLILHTSCFTLFLVHIFDKPKSLFEVCVRIFGFIYTASFIFIESFFIYDTFFNKLN